MVPKFSLEKEFEANKKYNDLLKRIASSISVNHITYDDFFGKYGYNRNLRTMTEEKFDKAMFDLDLRIPREDMNMIKSKLDKGRTGSLELEPILEIKPAGSFQSPSASTVKGDMTPKEREEVKSLVEEVFLKTERSNLLPYNYINTLAIESINLTDQFKKYDDNRDDLLTIKDFITVLRNNEMGVGAQDQDLLLRAFGDARSQKINYRLFCESVKNNFQNSHLAQSTIPGNVSSQKIEAREKALYHAIREQYATFEDVFIAHDKNGDSTISRAEFTQMLKALQLDLPSEEIEALFSKLDTKQYGKIQLVNFSVAFKTYVENDCRGIMSQIIRFLVNEGKSIHDVLSNYPQANDHMKFADFVDAIHSLSKKIGQRDLQFLLSFFSIKMDLKREINYEDFIHFLQSNTLKMNLANDVEIERIFRRGLKKQGTQKNLMADSPTKKNTKAGALDKFKIKMGLNSKEKILDFWRRMDRDNSKTVDLAEFKRTIKIINPDFTESELNQIFSSFDIADKGKFTSSDFLEVLTQDQDEEDRFQDLADSRMRESGGFKKPGNLKESSFRNLKGDMRESDGFRKSGDLRESSTRNLRGEDLKGSAYRDIRTPSQDIIEKTRWAKDIFLTIREGLKRKDEEFSSYFRAPDRKMSILEAKLKLNQLNLPNNEQTSQLLNELCDDLEPNKVNINYFEKAFNYHKDKYEIEKTRSKTPVDPYREVREALRKQDLTFEETFSRSDITKRGSINEEAFKTIISDDLRLYLNPETIRTMLDETTDRDGRISLVKLKEAIGLGRTAERSNTAHRDGQDSMEDLLKMLKTSAKNNGMSLEGLFKIFDVDSNGDITYKEFKKVMLKINSSVSEASIDKLFTYMDKNDNGKITLEEFQKHFEEDDDKADRVIKKLNAMLVKNGMDSDRAFELFDRNHDGVIQFSEFKDVLRSFDSTLSDEDQKFLYKKLDIDANGKLSMGEFARFFGVRRSPLQSDSKIQTLLNDFKSQIRSKNRSDLLRMFEMIDKNHTDRVEVGEFTDFVKTINPSISTSEAFDMFKLIDVSRDNYISFAEFNNQFNSNNYDVGRDVFNKAGRPGDAGAGLIERSRWASDILEEMGYMFEIEKTTFDDHFFSYGEKMDKPTFKKKIDALGMKLTVEDEERLIKNVTDPRSSDKVDMADFKKSFNYYKDGRNVSLKNIRKNRINQVVRDIRSSLNREGSSVPKLIGSLDRNGSGVCNKLDLEGILVDRYRVPNNTNLRFLYEVTAKDQDRKLIGINKLESVLTDDAPGEQYADDIDNKRKSGFGFDDRVEREYATESRPPLRNDDRRERDLRSGAGRDDEERYGRSNSRPGTRNNDDYDRDRDRDRRDKYDDDKYVRSNSRSGTRHDDDYDRNRDRDRRDDYDGRRSSSRTRRRDDEDYDRDRKHNDDRVNRPVEQVENVERMIDKLRIDIESAGIGIEQVYTRFNPKNPEKMNYEEFYTGVKHINTKLSRDDIRAMFNHLDKDRTDYVTKLKFVSSLGRVKAEDIPTYLSSARPLFQEINKIVDKDRLDLQRVLKVNHGMTNKADFRQGLYLIGINVDKNAKEIDSVQEALLEGRREGLSFDALEACLRRARNPETVQWTRKTDFTADEKGKIEQMFKEIAKFMKVDNITFESLFMSKDFTRQGWIAEKDFRHILFDELYVSKNPTLDLLIEYSKDQKGNIDLMTLRNDLKRGEQVLQPVMQIDHFLKELKARFKDSIDSIVKFYDENDNKIISRKEFVDSSKRAINLDKELAMFYFTQIDTKGQNQITAVEFRDFLEADKTNKRGFLAGLREFLLQNKNTVLRNMDSLDDGSRSGALTLSQIKIGLSNSNFRATNEELNDLVVDLNLLRDRNGKYNYYELIDSIIRIDPQMQSLAEADKVLFEIKDKTLKKAVDLVPLFSKHDTTGDHTIFTKDAFEVLGQNDVYLSKDDKAVLLPLMHEVNGRVNYFDFAKLIYNGREKTKTKNEFLRDAAWSKEFVHAIKDSMRRNGLTTPQLFRLQPNQEYISSSVFQESLDYLKLKMYTNDYRRLCDLLSNNDKPGYISAVKFDYLLQNIDNQEEMYPDQRYDDRYPDERYPNQRVQDPRYPDERQLNSKYPGQRPEVDEQKELSDRFSELRTFIKEDKKTFKDIFPKYDRNNTGFITQNDMNDVLMRDLGFDPNVKLQRFVTLMSDKRGLISLDYLRKNLDYSQPSVSFAGVDKGPNDRYPQDYSEAQRRASPYDQIQRTESVYGTNALAPPAYGARLGGTGPTSLNNIPEEPLQGPIVFNGDLASDIRRFFRSQRLPNDERFSYIAGPNKPTITKMDFVTKVKAMNIQKLTEQDIKNLAERLDVNRTGFISENEFRLHFDEQDPIYQRRDVKMTMQMVDEIDQLFAEIDTDRSGYLSRDEILRSLGQLGAKVTTEEANRLFEELDKNGDNKISREEFRVVMEDKIKKSILHLEGLLSELRTEFKRVDIYNKGALKPDQVGQALLNLKIELRPEELNELVKAIDTDKSGTIDIDEFIGFVMTPPESNKLNNEADNAVVNIKKSRKISLMDVLSSFRAMPSNFTMSFTRDETRKLSNLPSSAFKPKLNASGAFYTDVIPNLSKSAPPPSTIGLIKKPTPKTNSEIMTVPSVLAVKVGLNEARGVPLPPDQGGQRQSIVGREVRVSIFSRTQNRLVSNIISVPAQWDASFEGICTQ